MNITRIAILGVAAIAAGAAAMLARGMLTNRTTAQAPAPVSTVEILVASQDVSAGHSLDVSVVRWQDWPEKAMMPNFIVKTAQPDLAKAVAGTVARTPLIAGQPITETSIVRAGAIGFLAATVTPGMRAIGVPVSAETSAGGFILPNDRVDVVLTRDTTNGQKIFESTTILSDVRVLAVDQTAKQGKDQEAVVGKTATLELTPPQAELLARAQQTGVLSLTLRSIGDSAGQPTAKDFGSRAAPPPPRPVAASRPGVDRSPLVIYRYGLTRDAAAAMPAPAEPEAPAAESPAPSTQPNVKEGSVALETPR